MLSARLHRLNRKWQLGIATSVLATWLSVMPTDQLHAQTLFPAKLELSSLNGTNGFTINGISKNDRSGSSVSSAGDINGDGPDDLLIGASKADPGANKDNPNGRKYSGQTYVVFGTKTAFTTPLELSSLEVSNGFTINGIRVSDDSGAAISSVGDVNGDGVDDLLIGANKADPNGRISSGQTYVVFGRTPPNTAPVLAVIGNQTVNEGSALAFTATATDADFPANTLTFSLDATSTGKA